MTLLEEDTRKQVLRDANGELARRGLPVTATAAELTHGGELAVKLVSTAPGEPIPIGSGVGPTPTRAVEAALGMATAWWEPRRQFVALARLAIERGRRVDVRCAWHPHGSVADLVVTEQGMATAYIIRSSKPDPACGPRSAQQTIVEVRFSDPGARLLARASEADWRALLAALGEVRRKLERVADDGGAAGSPASTEGCG